MTLSPPRSLSRTGTNILLVSHLPAAATHPSAGVDDEIDPSLGTGPSELSDGKRTGAAGDESRVPSRWLHVHDARPQASPIAAHGSVTTHERQRFWLLVTWHLYPCATK